MTTDPLIVIRDTANEIHLGKGHKRLMTQAEVNSVVAALIAGARNQPEPGQMATSATAEGLEGSGGSLSTPRPNEGLKNEVKE